MIFETAAGSRGETRIDARSVVKESRQRQRGDKQVCGTDGRVVGQRDVEIHAVVIDPDRPDVAVRHTPGYADRRRTGLNAIGSLRELVPHGAVGLNRDVVVIDLAIILESVEFDTEALTDAVVAL